MAENKGYAGKIGHGGAQVVKAPYQNGDKQKHTAIRGTDLRTGDKSKSKGKK